VPVGGLDHLALAFTDLLADLLLCVDLGGVLCHHGGEEFVVGHGCFVHADSMAPPDGVWGVGWTLSELVQRSWQGSCLPSCLPLPLCDHPERAGNLESRCQYCRQ